MTQATARDIIVRKFTNYRNNRRDKSDDNGRAEVDALEANAVALMELRSYSKGKALFNKEKEKEIATRKAMLLAADPSLVPIGALQKAMKQLWAEADREFWEAQASSDDEEIYE